MLVLEKSPSSILPDHLSKTYAQYYQKEYGNILTNLTQPLLRISNADKKHFMLTPVSGKKLNANFEKMERKKFLDKKLLLIPELVKIHPIPGFLWRGN